MKVITSGLRIRLKLWESKEEKEKTEIKGKAVKKNEEKMEEEVRTAISYMEKKEVGKEIEGSKKRKKRST